MPNFSEGRRSEVVEEIARAAGGVDGAHVLDCHSDVDHNRMVLTIVGGPESVTKSVLDASAKAVELIDLRSHKGEHPRIGAVDVVPFVPLRETTTEECVWIAEAFAMEFSEKFQIPVYLYGAAARREERRMLSGIRSGQFELLRESIISDVSRTPDFGPSKIHQTAGATAVGARNILIAYNVNLRSNDLLIARGIARRIREKDGGLRFVQALGLRLSSRGIVQVSTNLTNYGATPVGTVFDSVSRLAEESKIEIIDSEIVGLVPRDALPERLDRLKLINFSEDKILENRLAKLEI